MEYMKGLPDKAFDLAIVDPPYGIGVNHNMGRRKGDKPSDYKPAVWDNVSPPQEYFLELFRVSKNQIIWGANHFISKMPKDSSCWLLWDKMFSDDLSFAQFEMAWTSFDSVCKKFTKDPKDAFRIHPTQKPVQLYKWCLKNYATCTHCNNTGKIYDDPGMSITKTEMDCDWCDVAQRGRHKILDTHGGSRSLAIACHQMGFDHVSCEIDKDYHEASVKRYNNAIMQQSLF